MRYHVLGSTGLRVSELAFGGGTFGAGEWGADKATARLLVNLFVDHGGNFIDTANVYGGGASEEYLGDILQGRRDHFVVASKYNGMTRMGDPNSAGNHRKNLVASLEASLRRLRTDRIDLLWIHARDGFTGVEDVMRALDDQVRAGKVLYVGASNWAAWEVSRANMLAELRGWTSFAGLQVRYNLLERTAERDILPMARTCRVGAFAWGPLAEGRLTGKYLRGGSGRLSVDNWAGEDTHHDEIVREVMRVAAACGATPAQVALAWLLGRPDRVVPILGATKEEQLRDSLGCLDVELEPAQVDRLDELSKIGLGFPHDLMRIPEAIAGAYGDQWENISDDLGRRAMDVV